MSVKQSIKQQTMAILVENYSDVQSSQLVKEINECIEGILTEMHDTNILIHVKDTHKFPTTQSVADALNVLFMDFFEGEEVDYDIDTAVAEESQIIRLHAAADALLETIDAELESGNTLVTGLHTWLNTFDEMDGDTATFTFEDLGIDPTLNEYEIEDTVYNTVRDILRSQKAWCINVWKGWGCQCSVEVNMTTRTLEVSLWYNV